MDLLSVQYWKYGGEFILEFARVHRGDLQGTWDELVPGEKRHVEHTSPLDRGRLEDRSRPSPSGFRGFRFDGFGDKVEAYEALAQHVVALLPQLETWLAGDPPGPNIHSFRDGQGSKQQ
jgi:hypothetical protein